MKLTMQPDYLGILSCEAYFFLTPRCSSISHALLMSIDFSGPRLIWMPSCYYHLHASSSASATKHWAQHKRKLEQVAVGHVHQCMYVAHCYLCRKNGCWVLMWCWRPWKARRGYILVSMAGANRIRRFQRRHFAIDYSEQNPSWRFDLMSFRSRLCMTSWTFQ